MKINIFEEIIKLGLILVIIIMIIKIFFNKENFSTIRPIDLKIPPPVIVDLRPSIKPNNLGEIKTIDLKLPPPVIVDLRPQIKPSNLGDIVVNNLTATSINIFPKGVVTAWAGTLANIPHGWVLCDGNNGTPNLLNRFIFGEGTGPSLTFRQFDISGGNETHTLTINEIGKHTHYFNSEKGTQNVFRDVEIDTKEHTGKVLTENIANTDTGPTGGNMPHNNMPPYYVLAFIMKL